MSRFAKVNLLEVEDSVAGRVEGLEGRFGRKHLDSRDLGVSLFRYAPNLRSPMAHSHKEQEEAYVVVAGSGRILLDDETQELRIWDVIRVAPEVVRAFEAGPDGLDVIAVGGPKPEEGDGVRATATWPDTESAQPGVPAADLGGRAAARRSTISSRKQPIRLLLSDLCRAARLQRRPGCRGGRARNFWRVARVSRRRTSRTRIDDDAARRCGSVASRRAARFGHRDFRERVMTYAVDSHTVSSVGLESSPVAPALAGLRAHEARYFKNKFDHVFTVEQASEAKEAIGWVHQILKQERDLVISSPPLEATVFEVENIRIAYLFYESGLSVNVTYVIDDRGQRAVGFKLSEGMEIPKELACDSSSHDRSRSLPGPSAAPTWSQRYNAPDLSQRPYAAVAPPARSRCLHPGQQQGRRLPSSSSSWVLRMRRARVISCLASSTQQMNSFRANGVMSFQASSAAALVIRAARRSTGIWCTTPPATCSLLTRKS